MRLLSILCLAALILVLAGCTPTPEVMERQPQSITLRYFTDEDDLGDAAALATAHCAARGGARLAAITSDEHVAIARFLCRT